MRIFSCNECSYASVTKKYSCPKCLKGKLEEQEVGAAGTVYSFTEVHVAPTEFASLAPYFVVLVELDDCSAKVTTRLTEPVSIGDRVDLDRVENGAYIYKKIG